jgi:hypothetical protein
MNFKTIKVSMSNYEWLTDIVSTIQKEEKRLVSFDEAISKIREQKMSVFAGSWKISKKKADELKKTLRTGWSGWDKKFA